MQVVVLVQLVSEVWWPTSTRGLQVQMFSCTFHANNLPFPCYDSKGNPHLANYQVKS